MNIWPGPTLGIYEALLAVAVIDVTPSLLSDLVDKAH